MVLPSRYHLVREWHLPTGRVSEPFVLDRHRKSLRPYTGSADARVEWSERRDASEAVRKLERMRARVLAEPTDLRRLRLADRLISRDRDCARLSAIFGSGDLYPLILLADLAYPSTTFTLSSAYVAGTSGRACAARYLSPAGGKTLSKVYFNISSYTGTAANVNDITVELRPEASAGAGTPDTATLTESKTVDPASATGWIVTTGWTSALAAMSRKFVIVGDPDGNGTHNAVLRFRATGYTYQTTGAQASLRYTPADTTNGWVSGNAVYSASAKIVLVFNDGTVFGDPLVVDTAPANDTNRRGLAIASDGLVADLSIFGACWVTSNANISGLEISEGSAAPGTAVDTSTDLIYNGAALKVGCLTNGGNPYTLSASTAYHIVATFSGNTTAGPQRIDIGTGETAELRAAMPGGGKFSYARANGTTDWSNDLVGSIPNMSLLIDGQTAVTPGGGGGIRIAGHGGLAA